MNRKSTPNRAALGLLCCLFISWISAGARGDDQNPAATAAVAPATNFAELRAQANQAAEGWNRQARLFRADLWGAYSGSRFRANGSRFLYFVANQRGGLEVRFENGQLTTFAYPLDPASPPRAIPDSVIGCDEAVNRLWDLAPTVSSVQIMLQLLWPGVEKPDVVDGERNATSYPLASLLKQFPVPLNDDESHAPGGRAVWRMLGVRDQGTAMDHAYGAFIYVDAVSGQALSERRPASGVQIYRVEKLVPASPVVAFDFPARGEITTDLPGERIGTFDALLVGQMAESMDLGLRNMIRDGRSEGEIVAAIDQMCNWSARMEQVRGQDAAHGVAALEQEVARNPKNYALQIGLFKRYVDEIERERQAVLAGSRANGDPLGLINEFELNDLGPGNPDQTLVKLNTENAGWILNNAGSNRPVAYSKYFAQARTLLRSLHTAGVHDPVLERQLTRLHWLISGNQLVLGLAIGSPEPTVDPEDAFQVMVYAEMNRLYGVSKLENAEAMRRPKISTSERNVTNTTGGIDTMRTTTVTQPSAEELAAAQRMEDLVKQQDAPQVAQIEDIALKLEANDPLVYFLWGRIEALYYDKLLGDRIIHRGLMIDPGCAALHAARVMAWADVNDVDYAENYVTTKLSGDYTAGDLSAGAALAKRDPWAAYFMSLQRLRLDPQSVAAHASLMDVLQSLDNLQTNGEEMVPDAREQHQREAGVIALMIERDLAHRADWSKAVPRGIPATEENLRKIESGILSGRGADLKSLDRPEEARRCFQKALTLNPGNAAAEGG